jgi:PKD domain
MKRLALFALVAAAVSCGPTTTNRIRPSLFPPLELVEFGAVPVLNVKVGELVLQNVGRGLLTVTNVTVTGEGFSLVSAPEQLETSQELPVLLSFKPREEKAYEGQLSYETNDPENPVLTAKLTGTGSTRAIMELNPPSLDFGRVAECSSAVRNFTIVSKGTADLVINKIEFTEGTHAAFSFIGSTRTPAVVKSVGPNGLNGQIQLTVKATVAAGSTGTLTGGIRIQGTDPDQEEVVIPLEVRVNQAPIAQIAPLGNGAPGQNVSLDGSGSSDPDGDTPLTYKWTMRQKPLSATTTIVGPEQPTTSMTLDGKLPGAYEVQLDVTDAAGARNCAPARATIVATPAEKLLVEMFWDNSDTDIDLHVLRTPDARMGEAPDDCHYANLRPDWGTPMDATDDPSFKLDALTGYGPELFGYADPAPNTYRLAVEFANEHLSSKPASNITVRVYLFGVVKGEFTRSLSSAGQRWAVADIEWPSGTVTAVP